MKYLFRGQTEQGEWIYGDLRHLSINKEKLVSIVDNSNGLNNSVCGITVKPETVGQWTGLCDINGTKIFDGDIVCVCPSTYSNKFIGYVKYSKENSRFGIMYIPTYAYNKKYQFCWFCKEITNNLGMDGTITIYYTYEVIGNIHDNPELLEAENA